MRPNLPYLPGTQQDWGSLNAEQRQARINENARLESEAMEAQAAAERPQRVIDGLDGYNGPLTQAGNPTLAGAKAATGIADLTSAEVREAWSHFDHQE